MALTYRKEVTTYVDCEVKIPKSFGMYTSAGNKMIAGWATKLVRDVEGDARATDAVKDFWKKYHHRVWVSDAKIHTEIGDTAVRESVFGFGELVLKAADGEYDYCFLDELWNEAYEAAVEG